MDERANPSRRMAPGTGPEPGRVTASNLRRVSSLERVSSMGSMWRMGLVSSMSLVLGLVGASVAGLGFPGGAAAQDLFTEPDPGRAPVLLIPGWGDDAPDLGPLQDRLVEAGWPASHILALAFEDPYGSSDAHAVEIGRAVRSLRGLTGASEVDIVAHSMGGLAVRELLESPDSPRVEGVRRIVFLATPHRGTVAAMLAWGDGGREMIPGSAFLEELNDDPGLPDDVEALSLRTPIDLRVIPGSSAMLPGARNVEVCCPTHQGLLDDPATFEQVRRFLMRGAEGLTLPDDSLPVRGDLLDREAPDR